MSPFDADAYWENRLRARYDERGVGDIGMSLAYNSYLYAVRRRVFRRCVRQLPLRPSATRVLDVGSGTGVYVDEWRRWGAAQVTGLDITDMAVARLRELFPGTRFVKADIGDSSGGDSIGGGYDVVSESDKVRQILGYMPDYFGVYNDLKVWEYLDFFAAAYKIPRARRGEPRDPGQDGVFQDVRRGGTRAQLVVAVGEDVTLSAVEDLRGVDLAHGEAESRVGTGPLGNGEGRVEAHLAVEGGQGPLPGAVQLCHGDTAPVRHAARQPEDGIPGHLRFVECVGEVAADAAHR